MDILKKYNKKKKINNLTIIWLSLVVALWVNFFILNNSNLQNNIKSNILESEKKENISDIFLEKNENKLVLKTSKDIADINSLSLSFVYNPENIKIEDIIPKLNSDIIKNISDDWIASIIINYNDTYNIKAWENILSLKFNKINKQTENINIINSNFTDKNGQTFELTNSSLSF